MLETLWRFYKTKSQTHTTLQISNYSPSSSSSSDSSSLSNVLSGISYNLKIGLLGSFTIRYLPSCRIISNHYYHEDIPDLLLHDNVQDAPDHAPGVVHVQVDLGPELHGLELLRAQDDVPGAVLDTVPVTRGYNIYII